MSGLGECPSDLGCELSEVSLGVRILTNSCWVCGLSAPQFEALVPRLLPLTFWKEDQSRGLVSGPQGSDSL